MNPKIAVNTRLLLKDKLEGIGRFTFEVMKEMVKMNPNVDFVFLFDRPYDPSFIFDKNVTTSRGFPPARHPYLYFLYFEFSVPYQLKKIKPNVFFSPDGFLSTRTKIPQVPVFHDLAFHHFNDHVSKTGTNYYLKNFPVFSKRADHILTVSEFTKQDIIQIYKEKPEKIDVIYNAANESFKVFDESVKKEIRQKYTQNQPYFIYVGAIQPRKNLERLIEAFNIFKEKTKSKYKLLLTGRKAWNFEEIIKSYAVSKFKEDIIFTGFVNEEELPKLYAASAALCYVSLFEGFGIPIVEAMQCGTPVITSNTSSMPEIAGDAALLVDPYKAESIAFAMEEIQNEALSKELIQKGFLQAKKFTWKNTAIKTFDILSKYF